MIAIVALAAACTPQRKIDAPVPAVDDTRISHDHHVQPCGECHRGQARPGADDHRPCAALSRSALTAAAGGLGDAHEPAALVTCNAPIPEPRASLVAELWRRAEPGFFDRLWPALRRAVRPGGMIVVHAARDAIVPALAGADGERVIVTYTPAAVRGFAIAWWRPDAAARFVDARRALTDDRPHLEPRDRDDALDDRG